MKKVSITHIDNRHNQWLRSLQFYKNELQFLKGRLTEIGGKNTGDEVLRQVEHFENQFKVQADNIDRLSHDIRLNIQEAGRQLQQSSAGYVDSNLITRHEQLDDAFLTGEKTINELRQEFNRFSATWM
ncbi:MAG: hypothetical protein JNL72_07925 [Flavipsychrobacter sp.]|nr:hypothetical protein [Flavipsychrobacter sp.]